MANWSDLTKLPTAPGAPAQTERTVRLYRDADWNSESWTMSLSDFLPSQRHIVPSSLYDQATYVAFNLPPGTVATLMDNTQPSRVGQNVADLSFCGICVDLVGTGQTEAFDLRSVGMNDLVSALFWREVSLDPGVIELYADGDFQGNRTFLFLSEWEPGKVHSIVDWWLNDKVSSVRWKTLHDRATAALFEHGGGDGNSFGNISGRGSNKENRWLGDERFNDVMSAFRWDGIIPKREIIKPFEVRIPAVNVETGFTDTVSVSNGTSESAPREVTFSKKLGKTFSVSTTDKFVTGISTTHGYKSASTSGGYEGSVTVNFSYERGNTSTQTYMEEVQIQAKQVIPVPKETRVEARQSYLLGELPPTEYQSTAERWYDVDLPGTTRDPANNWYKRVEPVRLTLQGGLVAVGTVDITPYPLT